MGILHLCVLIILLVLPPCILARRFCSSSTDQDWVQAILLVLGPFGIALLLDLSGVPLRRDTLLSAHCLYAALALLICLPGSPSLNRMFQPPRLPLGLLALAVLLFPYTRFTGIDTYKWQDLATAIQMEQTIPWHIHPVGMLGFLPRSYPSLQPTLLASIQIIGNLGVDGGFRILTLLTLWLGFTTSRCWFTRVFPNRNANLYACCYALVPVFVRYVHWTTGRGLFVALLPALLYGLAPVRPSHAATTRLHRVRTRLLRPLGIVAVAVLLVLSHKTAWIALPLLLVAGTCHCCLPRHRFLRLLLLVPVLGVAVLMSRRIGFPGLPGHLAGAAWSMATRFSWLLPTALWAWLKQDVQRPSPIPMAPLAFLLTLPLAFDPQMYGALIALPWIVYLALPFTQDCLQKCTPDRRRIIMIVLLSGLLLPSGAVLISRSAMAASAAVKDAAMFLNASDPEGPFRIHAPMPALTRLQAYATGCPRFVLAGNPALVTRIDAPPRQHNPFRQPGVQHWTAWLRNIIRVEGLEVQWYGKVQRHYHVTVDAQGTIPPHATLVYTNTSVQIYLAEDTPPQ